MPIKGYIGQRIVSVDSDARTAMEFLEHLGGENWQKIKEQKIVIIDFQGLKFRCVTNGLKTNVNII